MHYYSVWCLHIIYIMPACHTVYSQDLLFCMIIVFGVSIHHITGWIFNVCTFAFTSLIFIKQPYQVIQGRVIESFIVRAVTDKTGLISCGLGFSWNISECLDFKVVFLKFLQSLSLLTAMDSRPCVTNAIL